MEGRLALQVLAWIALASVLLNALSWAHVNRAVAGVMALSVPATSDCEGRLLALIKCQVMGRADELCCAAFVKANERGCFCQMIGECFRCWLIIHF
jgi:hypothetical protein